MIEGQDKGARSNLIREATRHPRHRTEPRPRCAATQGCPDNAIPLGKIKDGSEYEDEFEYEYDWGTIARFEPLLGRAMPTLSDRLLRHGQIPGSKKTLSAIALDPSSLLLVPQSYSNSSSYSVFFRRVRLRPNRDLGFQR